VFRWIARGQSLRGPRKQGVACDGVMTRVQALGKRRCNLHRSISHRATADQPPPKHGLSCVARSARSVSKRRHLAARAAQRYALPLRQRQRQAHLQGLHPFASAARDQPGNSVDIRHPCASRKLRHGAFPSVQQWLTFNLRCCLVAPQRERRWTRKRGVGARGDVSAGSSRSPVPRPWNRSARGKAMRPPRPGHFAESQRYVHVQIQGMG